MRTGSLHTVVLEDKVDLQREVLRVDSVLAGGVEVELTECVAGIASGQRALGQVHFQSCSLILEDGAVGLWDVYLQEAFRDVADMARFDVDGGLEVTVDAGSVVVLIETVPVQWSLQLIVAEV